MSAVKGLEYDGSHVNSSNDATPLNRVGEMTCIPTREGFRVFRYMKAQEAFAIGQAASLYLHIDDADVDEAAATTDYHLKGTSDFTASEFNDGTFRSAYVTIDGGASYGQTRAIIGNPGSTDYIKIHKNNPWDTALTTSSDFVTYDLNYVRLADSDETVIPYGVAVSAVTSDYYAWFQVGGFCPLVRCAGNTDALVAGEIVVASAAAGVVRGLTNGGTTADEVTRPYGISLIGYANADAAGIGAPVLLNCHYALAGF